MGKKKEQPQGPLGPAGVIICLVLQFLSLFFMAIGSPYDQFKARTDFNEVFPAKYVGGKRDWGNCYSLWGRKDCGGSHAGAHHDSLIKTCGVMEAVFKAGASFTIISIGLTVFTIVALFLLMCKCIGSKVPIVLFTLFDIICTCVPYACVAGLYHNPTCSFGRFSKYSKYGPGFPFLIVSFCMQVFAFIFACLI